MSSPVTHAVALNGALAGSGVDVWYSGTDSAHVILIADGPLNSGVSATNGFADYAQAALRHLWSGSEPVPAAVHWFEYDSTGAFDEVRVSAGEAGFLPLEQPGCQPRSAQAFLARIKQLAPTSVDFWREVLEHAVSPISA